MHTYFVSTRVLCFGIFVLTFPPIPWLNWYDSYHDDLYFFVSLVCETADSRICTDACVIYDFFLYHGHCPLWSEWLQLITYLDMFVLIGTPSLAEPKTLESVLDKLASMASMQQETEISMEINPTNLETQKLLWVLFSCFCSSQEFIKPNNKSKI